jgi:D-alanyl-D-alanine carboxypeptidase
VRVSGGERGQAAILLLAVAAAVLLGAGVLVALGQALGARGGRQRAADLAAVSAASAMRTAYPRLFEPADARHLTRGGYLALARRAAVRAARLNGVALRPGDVSFPRSGSFAPIRVAVVVRDRAAVRLPDGTRPRIAVRARAVAELSPPTSGGEAPLEASGGGYDGPLAYRQGKPMRPDVALAFDRMYRAARAAGVSLIVVSGYRSDREQARLFAQHPDPRWVAPPGKSLHRLGTELDLGPPAAYGWLRRNARRFGFIQRYSWEPWH